MPYAITLPLLAKPDTPFPATPHRAMQRALYVWLRAADEDEPPTARTAASIGSTIALVMGDQTLVFCRRADHKEERFSFRVQRGTKRILIFGAIRGARYWVSVDGERVTLPASKEGVITWHPPEGFAPYVTILKSVGRGGR